MKVALCIVGVILMVSVEAVPAPLSSAIVLPTNEKDFFKKKLASIQGALKDTFNAGLDLQIMEARLKDIVAASSYFYLTESATEYATAKNAYANGWKAGPDTPKEDMERLYTYDCTVIADNDMCSTPFNSKDDGKTRLGSTLCPTSCAGV